MIELDYTKDKELFNETAKEWAEKISGARQQTKKTQIRNFYEYVLDLHEKAQKEPFEEILPFVKMLNSKVSYAVERRVASREFQEMMQTCVNQVNDQGKLKVFKLFFEAVIGFYKEDSKGGGK